MPLLENQSWSSFCKNSEPLSKRNFYKSEIKEVSEPEEKMWTFVLYCLIIWWKNKINIQVFPI